MSALRNVVLVLAAWLAFPAGGQAQLPFFPGAEGFGGTFAGAAPAGGWFSNGTIYHVTTNQDAIDAGTGKPAQGTLRGAFYDYANPNSPKQNASNRVVVFDVGGTFVLNQGPLDIKTVNTIYIAGQTAPSPVTVYGNTTQITKQSSTVTSNVVLRYMTFRKGTGDGEDAITFSGGSGAGDTVATNMILDHVSASWAEDEDLSVANNNTNVTVQYSVIADALTSGHAYGSLIRPQIDSSVTFHHNLYANNQSRQARFGTYNGETLTADFRNNVIYNWKQRASYSGGSSEAEQESADVNYVGNYLVAGPGLQSGYSATQVFGVDKNTDTRIYQSGNYVDSDRMVNAGGAPNGSVAPASAFAISTLTDQTLTMMANPFPTAPVTTQAAPAAFDQVMQYVGNSWWARDPIDARIINNVKTNTGPPGGIGAAAPNASEHSALLGAPLTTRPVGWDTDNDGMPDAWEKSHGLNPSSAADAKLDFDSDGYVNVVEYVNEVGEFPAPAPIVFQGGVSSRYAQILNWRTSDASGGGSPWQPSKYDTAVISSGTVVVDAAGQHAGTLQVAPQAGDSAVVQVAAGWLQGGTLAIGAGGNGQFQHTDGIVAVDAIELGGAGPAAGTYTLAGNGLLLVTSLSRGSGGGFTMTGGTLTAEVVSFPLVNQGGVISPGVVGSGDMHVASDFTNAAGAMRLELRGTALGQYDRILVDGHFAAGGTLDIDLIDSYVPAAGDTFDLLNFASASGALQVSAPALPAGLAWNTSALLTTGLLTVSSTASPNADFNGDGTVDGGDFVVWQSGLGLSGQQSNASGDADRDGVVDADDLLVWRAQYGGSPAAGASAAVPEAGGATLALLAAAACLIARRR
ncbi:MAG TPA: hypothetical protein VEQ85_02485 [Lacipirellulaceae bacterium]|nr:hypothetical protein [Lacipirellulaceae bacterium]